MTPPEAPMQGRSGDAGVQAPAVCHCAVLAQRADYLRAARSIRQGTPGFLLQARRRTQEEAADPAVTRIGITCSKKIGNAVTRNRAKRRLRAIARAVMPLSGRAGWDYVLVGRPQATVTREFAAMCADLERTLAQIHAKAE